MLHTTNDDAECQERSSRNSRLLFGGRAKVRGILNTTGLPRRLFSIGAVMVTSYVAYLLGTALLNRIIVDKLGVSRRGDAFGPFATLLSLIYSIVLGQIYHYFFERQQMIQNCLYEEASALQLLFHVCQTTTPGIERRALRENTQKATNESDYDGARSLLRAPLKEYAQNFLQTAFSKTTSWKLRQDVPQKLVELAALYDTTTSSSRQSSSSLLVVANAIQAATSARALRISHVNSDLPVVQKITERLLSYVILGGFVLVDLQAPILEALLFSVIAGCFATIHGFLMDLSDPFSGQWTVGTHIREDLKELIRLM